MAAEVSPQIAFGSTDAVLPDSIVIRMGHAFKFSIQYVRFCKK